MNALARKINKNELHLANRLDVKGTANMTAHPGPIELSVLLFESPQGKWAAQCLEYDIAAQANSFSDIIYEFQRVIMSHLAFSHELDRKPFDGIEAAPDKFW